MNIYGEQVEASNDLTGDVDISGDLNVSGDGFFNNITVSDTATIQTLITEQELKVEDPLIELGINNPSDNLNLGLIEHFNNGTDRYSGLIRDRITKKQYLFENALALPNTTTDMTTLPRGALVVGSLEISNYSMPPVDGTANQTIQTDGVGNLTFVDTASSNPFDQDLNTTDDVKFEKIELGSGDAVFTIDPNSGSNLKESRAVYDNAGSGVADIDLISRGVVGAPLALQSGDRIYQKSFLTNDSVGIRNCGSIELNCTDSYASPNQGGTEYRVQTLDNGQTVPSIKLICNEDGLTAPSGLVVGTTGSGYTMPNARGTADQYLTTDSNGVVSWTSQPVASPPPNISVQQGGSQTLANNLIVAVNFSVELFKDNITHDNVVNNSRLTIVEDGLYSFSYDVWFDVSNDGGRTAFMAVNGLLGGTDTRYGRSQLVVDDIGGDTNPISLCGSSLIALTAGDYVEVYASQNSGAPLNIGNANISTQGEFTAFKVEGSSGGSGGSQTLQQTYNLSSSPEITTALGQGLTIKSGGVDGLEQVLKIEDNLGVVNARINASGLIVGDALSIVADANIRTGLSLGSIPAVFDYSFPVDNQTAEDESALRYDTSTRSLKFDNRLNFNQTETKSAINTAIQQEFTGAGVGSRTILANTVRIGSKFKIKCMGVIQTTGVQTMTIRFFLAGILVAVSKVGTLNLLTQEPWVFEQDMTVRQLGAGGLFNFSNSLSWNSVGGGFNSLINDSAGVIDTTQDNLIQVFAQWGGAGISNQMFCRQLSVEQII